MNGIEIPFHVGDFLFFADRPNHERLVVVWQVYEDGRLELVASGSRGHERFETHILAVPSRIRKPNETEGRMIASAWFDGVDYRERNDR